MKRMFLSLLASLIVSTYVHAVTLPDVSVAPEPKLPLTQLNLNTADVASLAKSVKGIGQKRAEAIIKYRETHQGFKSINELANVPGIGEKFVNKRLDELQQKFTIQ